MEERDDFRIRFLRRIRNYLIAGILVTAPLAITVYLTVAFISVVDELVARGLSPVYNPQTHLALPGFGLIVVILLLILIGFLTTNLFGQMLMRLFERVVNVTPVVRHIYGSLKQVFESTLSEKSNLFRDAVLVEYPRKGIWMLGFMTGTTKGEVQQLTTEEVVNVFIPTTPNPTSGFLIFVPKNDIVYLDITVEDAFKMVITSGIITPLETRTQKALKGGKKSPKS